MDTIERILLNPTIEELNNTNGSIFPYINPDTTLYIMIYANGPPFIKKLHEFIISNDYYIDELTNIDTKGIELSKIQFTITKNRLNHKIL